MSAWKPGDVAMVDGRLAVRGGFRNPGDNDRWWLPDTQTWTSSDHDARPLLVIDPEDREQVERLTRALTETSPKVVVGLDLDDRDAMDAMHVRITQAALRSLLTPPKPDEPKGLGAVVEDAEGDRWISHRRSPRHETPSVKHMSGNQEWANWSDIAAVRVLSEGVAPNA